MRQSTGSCSDVSPRSASLSRGAASASTCKEKRRPRLTNADTSAKAVWNSTWAVSASALSDLPAMIFASKSTTTGWFELISSVCQTSLKVGPCFGKLAPSSLSLVGQSNQTETSLLLLKLPPLPQEILSIVWTISTPVFFTRASSVLGLQCAVAAQQEQNIAETGVWQLGTMLG